MVNFKISRDVIMASHITGVYDVNRNTILKNDDFSIVTDWAKSVSALKLQGIIFHNNFSDATCKANESSFIKFIKVDYNSKYNPNVFRYFVYNEFIKENAQFLNNIFFTDVSDVVVLKNPFLEPLFLNNPNAIFCGDEPKILGNSWMQNHSEHLRNEIPNYKDFEVNFKNHKLLNCGVIGGQIILIQRFIKDLWSLHFKYNSNNTSSYTGDMGAFNYLVRTQYNENVIHGYPVNTEFKKYLDDTSCWFKHK